MNQAWRNCKKFSFWCDFGTFRPNSGCHFFLNLAFSVTRYHGQLSSCIITEKTNDAILRKLSDGRTDWQTDGQTGESDFIGRCPTNVERQKKIIKKFYKKCEMKLVPGQALLWFLKI